MGKLTINLDPPMTEEEKAAALDINPEFCFVCQTNIPAFMVKVDNREPVMLCADCTQIVKSTIEMRNRIKTVLYRSDSRRIFQYTLGLDPTPQTIQVIPITSLRLNNGEAKGN